MKFLNRYRNFIIGILLLVVCLITWYVWMAASKTTPTSDEYVWDSSLEPEYIEYEGQKYTYNPRVETVLLGGVDNEGKIVLSGGNGTGGEADVLFLLVINNASKTVDTIQINRDTLTSIDILNDNYKPERQTVAQIALSHSYGNGGSISCNNTVTAVENLLFGIDIDKYLFVNMGAMPVINDFFGGVEVRIEEDFSEVDPSLVRWRRINLSGKQAYNFLRARKGIDDSSNENRMKRHRQYVDGLLEKVRESVGKEELAVSSLYNQIYDYTATSLSSSEIASLAVKVYDYTHNDIIVPEGEFGVEDGLAEFYVNDEKLKEIIMELFYTPIE